MMLFNIVKTYCFNPFEKCCWADLKLDFQENGKIFGHQGRIENVDIAVKIFGISYFGFNKRPGEENYEIRGTSEILNQKEVKER